MPRPRAARTLKTCEAQPANGCSVVMELTPSQAARRHTCSRSCAGARRTAQAAARKVTAMPTAHQAVFTAFDQIGAAPGVWVQIAVLRSVMGGLPGAAGSMSRTDQDRALNDLYLHPRVVIMADADERRLSDQQRRAAVIIGGEARHLIQIKPEAATRKPASRPRVPAPTTPEQIETAVRAAYVELVDQAKTDQNEAPLIGLAAIRRHRLVSRVSREQVDLVLDEMITRPDVYLMSEANRKALTKTDLAAAVKIGGQDKHMISIRPRPFLIGA